VSPGEPWKWSSRRGLRADGYERRPRTATSFDNKRRRLLVEKTVLELLGELSNRVDMPAYLLALGYAVTPGSGKEGIELVKGQDAVRVMRAESGVWCFTDGAEPWRQRSMADFLREREGLPAKEALSRVVELQHSGTNTAVGLAYQQVRTNRPPELQAAEGEMEREQEGARLAERLIERLGLSRGNYDEWRFGKLSRAALERLPAEPADQLWGSRSRASDKTLVLVERPLDAVAYEAAQGRQECCYVAVGKLSDEQARKLAHVLGDVKGLRVALAFGATDRGKALAERVRALAPMVRMERDAPSIGKWAEALEMQERHRLSLRAVVGVKRGIAL